MNEIKVDAFLTELMEYSRTVGNKKDAPFTAERFVVAVIDKIQSTTILDRTWELDSMEQQWLIKIREK